MSYDKKFLGNVDVGGELLHNGEPFVGQQGATGPSGPQGYDGATGVQGPQGFDGATGIQGPSGLQGFDGATGPQGETGPSGYQGATGPKGDTGKFYTTSKTVEVSWYNVWVYQDEMHN